LGYVLELGVLGENIAQQDAPPQIDPSQEKTTPGLSLNWWLSLPGQWTQRWETAAGVAAKRETWTRWPSLVWLRAAVAALTRSEM
jgi:hypothetical protein